MKISLEQQKRCSFYVFGLLLSGKIQRYRIGDERTIDVLTRP
ncbi:hypothetical protein HMPREF0083_02165 [Aneurinibacillus aneurinilyticus ATCC 12856]|uniref:Uncharacterized protein n=1 Tax=Aneurinibacillus aneurinilyticus ATCC 12856 TaxID=649747 RepID=U1X4B5_ANEAE|nr:hypothetical protein HMPREF0083_02165 [Aneurinibacillus aneurinilyticus ATCC 12856]